jgi:hypothetical protein
MAFLKAWRSLRSQGVKATVRVGINAFLFGRAFDCFERLGLHVLPIHHYSPVPDTRVLKRELARWYRPSPLVGIDLRRDGQIRTLEALRKWQPEYAGLPPYEEIGAQGLGEGYGAVEGQILHGMIRHARSRRVVEVGSGVSTWYATHALARATLEDGIAREAVCIEPFARRPLVAFQRSAPCRVTLLQQPVERVNPQVFRELQSGDVLFLDSTHMVRLGGDVSFLYLEVLPQIREGVLVHIHDISWPYPSPDPEGWVFRRHQFWTEAALVQAFMMYNTAFEIVLCSSYWHWTEPERLRATFPDYNPRTHFPSSLWLRKVSSG